MSDLLTLKNMPGQLRCRRNTFPPPEQTTKSTKVSVAATVNDLIILCCIDNHLRKRVETSAIVGFPRAQALVTVLSSKERRKNDARLKGPAISYRSMTKPE